MRKRQLLGLVVPRAGTQVQRLDLRGRLGTRSGVLGTLKGNQHRTGKYLSIQRGERAGDLLDLSFASEAWVEDPAREEQASVVVRRRFEVCVFSHLAAELRSGDIAVLGSDSYANLHAQLLSWESWSGSGGHRS